VNCPKTAEPIEMQICQLLSRVNYAGIDAHGKRHIGVSWPTEKHCKAHALGGWVNWCAL